MHGPDVSHRAGALKAYLLQKASSIDAYLAPVLMCSRQSQRERKRFRAWWWWVESRLGDRERSSDRRHDRRDASTDCALAT
jgi:hypothetical protein